MNQRQLALTRIVIVVVLGLGGALSVTGKAGCGWIDFGESRVIGPLTIYRIQCGPVTFARLLFIGVAGLISIWLWQRELKRQESAIPTHKESSPS